MFRSSISFPVVVLVLLLCACHADEKEALVWSKDGYEETLSRVDSLMHQGGNTSLWYRSSEGQRRLIWGRLVSDGKVLDGVAVWSGGLTDDEAWKYHPTLLASEAGGAPVLITEFVVRKYCLTHDIGYAPYVGKYGCNLESETQGLIALTLLPLPGTPRESRLPVAPGEESGFGIKEVQISCSEVKQWIQKAQAEATKKTYHGVEYLVPNLSGEVHN